jgi:Protein of unknown function (DUF2934)
MPKAPRDKDSATPKKRTRKAAPEAGNGVHAANGNGATASVTAVPEVSNGASVSPSLEEQIRARAYQIYLERGGDGGSPEQDWLRAKEEICGRATTA